MKRLTTESSMIDVRKANRGRSIQTCQRSWLTVSWILFMSAVVCHGQTPTVGVGMSMPTDLSQPSGSNRLTHVPIDLSLPIESGGPIELDEPGELNERGELNEPIDSGLTVQPASFCPPGICAPVATQYPRIRVTGFFQADAGWFHQDEANIAAVGNIQDGADFRRARLAAVGEVAENVGYNVEFDFGFPGRPSFMDVWLEVRDLTALQNLRVGLYRQPFGLDGLTSVKELTFIERGLPFVFLPFRQIGVMAHGQNGNEDITWAVSGFRFPTDLYGSQIGDGGGYGMATRLTGVLLELGKDGVLHVGSAYSVIDPANDAVRYASPPEFFISETGGAAFVPVGVPTFVPPFVDTMRIPTEIVNLYEVEMAATYGPYHGQSEAVFASVDRLNGSGVAFTGVSAQAACILSGEHRPYNRTAGVLGRVVPDRPFGKGGCGAWEVAARWSYLDLNDKDIRGGRLNDVTLGINWYLNRFTKFQFNYIHAYLNDEDSIDSNADIFATRAQLDF